MSELDEELNSRRSQNRHVMRASEITWSTDTGGPPGREAWLVSPELGFNIHNFGTFLLEIPPGSERGAYHTHGEAVKYYLRGHGTEIIGEKRYELGPGDAAFIPAFTWHGTQNRGTEPILILGSQTHGPILQPVILGDK